MTIMATLRLVSLAAFILFISITVNSQGHKASIVPRKVFIVILDSHIIPTTRFAHMNLLKTVLQSIKPEESLLYDYSSGFAAKLSASEAKHLASVKGVLTVLPDQVYHIDNP